MSQLGEIRVRAANAEDFDKIVTIIRKLASSDGRSDQVQVTPERLAKDNGLQNDPQLFACAVAERRAIDSNQFELIGYVTWYYGFTSWEGKIAYLEDLYLEELFRSAEFAGKLLAYVAKDTRTNSAVWLRFSVRKTDRTAIEIYKTLGAQDVTAKYDYHIWSFDQQSLRRMADH